MPDVKDPEAAPIKAGRRQSDWQLFTRNGRSIFFWLFGMFLDERHKPSMSRCMLALWTYAGWLMIQHELRLKPGGVSLPNIVWTCWWAAEGVLALAVFGPSIASYFGSGGAGAIASSLVSATRETITKEEHAA